MSSVEENIDRVPVSDNVIDMEIKQDWTDAEAQEAEAMGWIPPDRSKKLPEGRKFKGPVEYMEGNPLYSKMKTLESSIGQLTEHYQKVSERDRKAVVEEYEAKIETLKAKKVEAMDEGNHQAVVDIDEAIRTTEKPAEEPEADPVFDSWVANNDWYEKDNFLSVQADTIAEKYLGKGLRGKELLDTMTTHMKKAYPDSFKTERDRPSAVEGDTRGAPRKPSNGELTEKDLTADERTIYRKFEHLGAFPTDKDKQKYFKDAVDLRD